MDTQTIFLIQAALVFLRTVLSINPDTTVTPITSITPDFLLRAIEKAREIEQNTKAWTNKEKRNELKNWFKVALPGEKPHIPNLLVEVTVAILNNLTGIALSA